MRALWMAIAMAALAAPGFAASAPPPGRTEFQVFRNGGPFGSHIVEVRSENGRTSVRSIVNFRASAGPVTLYQLRSECVESWREAALQSLNCTNLRGGKRSMVKAVRQDGALLVTSARTVRNFSGEAAPTSWWSKPRLGRMEMIDTQTGKPMPVTVTSAGWKTIEAAGRRIEAEHLRVQGTLVLNLWYDREGRWVAGEFNARGQRIEYRMAS